MQLNLTYKRNHPQVIEVFRGDVCIGDFLFLTAPFLIDKTPFCFLLHYYETGEVFFLNNSEGCIQFFEHNNQLSVIHSLNT